VRHHVVAVHLHHFARDRAEDAAVGEVVDEAGLGFGQPDLERVPVERPQAFDFAAVVELAGGLRLLAQVVQADQLRVAQRRIQRALPARVVDALGRVDVVVRREFGDCLKLVIY
jgi:hypothetical protein